MNSAQTYPGYNYASRQEVTRQSLYGATAHPSVFNAPSSPGIGGTTSPINSRPPPPTLQDYRRFQTLVRSPLAHGSPIQQPLVCNFQYPLAMRESPAILLQE